MPRRLTDLKITNVDRVRAGANGKSRIVLFKAHTESDEVVPDAERAEGDEKGNTMAIDMDALEPEVRAEVEALIAERDELKTGAAAEEAAPSEEQIADEVEKALAALTAEQIVDRFEGVELAPTPEPEMDDVLKGLPEAVVAEIQKGREAAERVSKMEEREAIREQTEFAKSELAGLTEAPAELGETLHDIRKSVSEDQWQAVARLLKSAAAQAAEAQDVLMAERGSGAAPMSDGAQALADRQAEIAKAHDTTPEQALLWIADNEPEFIVKARG
ncbi:MAG: hypothetical protein U9R15_19530 [Chloroflexota bacterium]|nr:hypothetical protein [Chloroflexota bacterium]